MSIGDAMLNCGSAIARVEKRSLMSAWKELRSMSLVIEGNTHACIINAGSDAKRGRMWHSTIPFTLTIGVLEMPLTGMVHGCSRNPRRVEHATVMALIWDAEFTRT
jgi:hypothetical protein